MAFHPSGEYLAIAAGPHLLFWDWMSDSPHLPPKYQSKTVSPYNTISIMHTRSIRAVIFHPSGKYLFIGAPDGPKVEEMNQTYCK